MQEDQGNTNRPLLHTPPNPPITNPTANLHRPLPVTNHQVVVMIIKAAVDDIDHTLVRARVHLDILQNTVAAVDTVATLEARHVHLHTLPHLLATIPLLPHHATTNTVIKMIIILKLQETITHGAVSNLEAETKTM